MCPRVGTRERVVALWGHQGVLVPEEGCCVVALWGHIDVTGGWHFGDMNSGGVVALE